MELDQDNNRGHENKHITLLAGPAGKGLEREASARRRQPGKRMHEPGAVLVTRTMHPSVCL
jgi:hypothetical protein